MREYSTRYTVEIQRPDSYSTPVTKPNTNHKRMERLAKGMVAKQPVGTRVYVVTCGVVLTTYTAI